MKLNSDEYVGTRSMEMREYEKKNAEVARKIAAEGIVLLKNDRNMLPIKKKSKIALFGAGASRTVKGGTGSGDVNERKSISIYEGLNEKGYKITTKKWLKEYDETYQKSRIKWKNDIQKKSEETGSGLSFFSVYSRTPFRAPAGDKAYVTDTDTAVYVLSRTAGEGIDRHAVEGDYFLSEEENNLLEEICHLYKNVLLIINTGGIVDLSFLDKYEQIRTVLYVSQPGQEGGRAVADIISGDSVPSGKLTDSWAFKYEDYPNAETFSYNDGNLERELYKEGIYVGYRYFDSFNVPVRFCFGYGKSYTDFKIESKEIIVEEDGTVKIIVDVTNCGKRFSGKEVIQVYVSLPSGKLEKEYRRLCAFEKTKELNPGETESLEVSFTAKELCSYNEGEAAWILEAGKYGIFLGGSLSESCLIGSLNLKEEKVIAKAENICPLKEKLEEISIPPHLREKREQSLRKVMSEKPQFDYSLTELRSKTFNYDYVEPEDQAMEIAKKLSLEKLILLSTGDPGKGQGSQLGSAGITVAGSAGQTSSCAEELGVDSIVLADGPAGLRLHQYYTISSGEMKTLPFMAAIEKGFLYDGPQPEGIRYYQYCTAFPVGTLAAQSWNKKVIQEMGEAVGTELELFHVTLWLAPGMNIHRNPLCGRNFEYYSEDPFLSGMIAAAMTKGVQSHSKCGTTIKHYACNNQEDNRMQSDSVLSERALREIYLRGFGIAISEAQPLALMTSYNLINGVYTANSFDLCMKGARCEFGFKGLIMTDWTTTEKNQNCTASGCIHAGNDLIMPGKVSDHINIQTALENGHLKEKELRECIARIIRVILRTSFSDRS